MSYNQDVNKINFNTQPKWQSIRPLPNIKLMRKKRRAKIKRFAGFGNSANFFPDSDRSKNGLPLKAMERFRYLVARENQNATVGRYVPSLIQRLFPPRMLVAAAALLILHNLIILISMSAPYIKGFAQEVPYEFFIVVLWFYYLTGIATHLLSTTTKTDRSI